MPEFAPRRFMLLPTMACQASCRYCFAQKTGAVMSLPTAEAAMDFIDRIAPGDGDIWLTFHGGDGLAGDDIETTIENIGRMGRDGMHGTDIEILNIMVGQ